MKRLFFALGYSLLILTSSSFAADLLGINYDNGDLYRVSTADASLGFIGNTHVTSLGALDFSPDGRLFGFTSGPSSTLYQIDPNTAGARRIGPLNFNFVFEGDLAFAPNGTAYGVNEGSATVPALFTLDLATGQATRIGVISGGPHDINGLGWRSDGQLVGLDRESNSLLAIDPNTAASSVIAHLNPTVGSIGGMALLGDAGYFSTSGPSGPLPGSNELYFFNAFTGEYHLVGGFSPTITGTGIGDLAMMVPEPSTTLLVALAAFLLALPRFSRNAG